GAGTAIGDRPEQQKLPGCGRSPDRATCLHESSGRGQETGPSYMKRETGPSDRYNILATVACGWQGCGLHFLQQHSLALEAFYRFLPVGGSFAAICFNLLINVPINVAVAGVPIFAIPLQDGVFGAAVAISRSAYGADVDELDIVPVPYGGDVQMAEGEGV